MMLSETGTYRKYIIQATTLFLLLLNSFLSSAQDHIKADSLIKKWEMHLQDSSALVQSKALIEIGRSLRYQNPDSATYYFKKSLAIAQKSHLPKQIAKATSAIGGVHYVKGEYDFAMENFTKALNIYDSLNDKKGIASGLNNMGLIQNMQEHYDDAILNHQKSIRLCHETGDSALLAINLLNLGICYHTKGDQDKAIDYFNRSETINKKLNSKRGVTQINNMKGQAYLKKGEFDKARVLFERILKQGGEVNKWELVYAHAGMAEVYLKTRSHQQSIIHAKKAMAIAKELEAKWDLQEITGILAKNYEATSQWKSAYHYHKLHKAYSDSVFNEKKENQINYQRLKRKEIANKNLEKENKLKQLKLTKRNHQMWAFIVAMLFLIVLTATLFRNNQLKSQLNRNLRKKNQEIEEKNAKLSELNTTKDILFRVMAHDLKNPISLVISYTEMMEEDFGEFDKEELLDFIKKLNQTSHEGLQLLENLMDWARSQTGAINVNPETFDIYEILNENLSLISHNAASKNITINKKVGDNTMVWADKNMTSAIIRNLLTNAVKFSHFNGLIEINAGYEEKYLKIEIKDHGVGMTDKQMDKLFKLDQKNTTVGTNKEKGTGLGLIICKDFARKQGGDIAVNSTPGKGSAFTLKLNKASH